MNFVSLFAGIGGFDLGFERAGMQCVAQVENDRRCDAVLTHHWPNVDRSMEDVRNFGKRTWNGAAVDLVCGGFPCQDLSVAGRRAGLAGKRSGLWWEFARVVEELLPRWVVVENVPGLLSSNDGRDMGTILWILAKLGYGYAYRVLDAQYFGVPQRRRRVFIVGHLGDGRAAEVLFERGRGAWDPPPSRETRQRIADPITASFGKHYGRSAGKDSQLRNAVVYSATGNGWWNEDIRIRSLSARDWHDGGPGLTIARPLAFGHTVNHGDESQQTYVVQSVALRGRGGGATAELGGEVAAALRASQGGSDKPFVLIPSNVSGTLNSSGNSGGFRTEPGEHLVIAIAWQQGVSPDDRSYPVRAGDYAGSLSTTRHDAVAGQFGVRRLTPLECERLQGFPDGWTLVVEDKIKHSWEKADQDYLLYTATWYAVTHGLPLTKDVLCKLMSDSVRYRTLGNAVCVPVAKWIGERIVAVEGSEG